MCTMVSTSYNTDTQSSKKMMTGHKPAEDSLYLLLKLSTTQNHARVFSHIRQTFANTCQQT